MEELFEILEREKLDTDERIERAIMHDRPVSEIMDVVARISQALDRPPPPSSAGLAAFDFLPNADIGAGYWGCSEWECRVGRAERLARFAALWADRVLIRSYFGDYAHPHAVADSDSFRRRVAGDLKVVLALKPLLQAGIIQLFNPRFHFCADCARRFEGQLAAARGTLRTAKGRLARLYVDRVEVWFRSWPGRAQGDLFTAEIRGPEDIVPHGSHFWVMDEPPAWLPQRVKGRAYQEDLVYKVPPSRMRATGLLSRELDVVAADVLMQHMLSRYEGTKYLTDRQADVAFLRAVNDRDEYAAWTDVLAQHLQYEMPIIEGVPLGELVAIRRAEHDAFLVYRDTLKDIIRNHVAEHPAPSGREAQQIYDDVVRPSLNRMNAKVSSIRRSLAERTGRDVVITGGLVGVGVSSGLLPADLAPLVGAVGGLSIAKEVLTSLASLRSPPGELRNENLYFLWKIGQKAARRRKARTA